MLKFVKLIKSSLEDKIYNIADDISEEIDGYVSNSYSVDEYEEGVTWSISFSLDEYEDSSFSDYGFEETDMQNIINNIKNKYKKFDIELAEFDDEQIDIYVYVKNKTTASKSIKADQSNYTDEDKKIFQETHKLMEECKSILDFYLSRDEDFNFDDYTLDETDRVYNKADLEALKEIKNKLEVLFTK